MSSTVIARGTLGRLAPKAVAEGEIVGQPRASSAAMWSSPSHGRLALALRPAWPIWMPGTAPAALIEAAIGASAAACALFHRPVQLGEMRPSGDTAVASTMTRPAPPRAIAG